MSGMPALLRILADADAVWGTADLILFLLSERAGFLTGEVISIDGGATAMNPARPSGQRLAGP